VRCWGLNSGAPVRKTGQFCRSSRVVNQLAKPVLV
jgi:hypothetical protein